MKIITYFIIGIYFCLINESLQKKDDHKLNDDQKKASVRLHVFTSENKNKTFEIKYDEKKTNEKDQNFSSICDFKKPLLKFIIHGFAETWNMTNRWDWVSDMRKEMFKSSEANQICFIAVDWKELGRGGTLIANYWQATKNMQIAADLLTNFFMLNKIDEKNMHCIGFSLGSHMCGVFFEVYYKKIKLKPGRITGLDPAGPFFKDKSLNYKLDLTDAQFVDIIHTSKNFGLSEKSGHMDFFEDEGKVNVCNNVKDRFQNNEYVILYEDDNKEKNFENVTLSESDVSEGVNKITESSLKNKLKNLFKKIKNFFVNKPKRVFLKFHQFFGCSHLMSVRMFIYSINDCLYKTIYCPKIEDFKKNNCQLKNANNITKPRMGYYADRAAEYFKKLNGNFFVKTKEKPPYCFDPIGNFTKWN